MIDFGREVCGRVGVSSNREWLVTNGIGGYAMGTISGILTRRYHGLLVAALNPPLGRTLMLTKLDETVLYNGEYYRLYADRWFGDPDTEGGLEEPLGFYHLERFHLEGTIPCWTYACADAVLEKRVWMKQGENTTYIQYRLVRASGPMSLYPRAMINFRDYHQTTIAEDYGTEIEMVDHGIEIRMFDLAEPLYLLSDRAEVYPQEEWYEDYFLSLEKYRGLPDVVEDHLHIADFSVTLQPGESTTIVASTLSDAALDGMAAFEAQRAHEQALVQQVIDIHGDVDEAMQQLVVAGDQFIVERSTPNAPNGHSIIAGYPWFSDWGRHTMISLPGLTLCNGRHDIAASILRTFAQYVDQGMLPNRFPDEGETPDYNAADAGLWYFQAIRTYIEATEDDAFLEEIYRVLQNIIAWHQRGTRYNIKVDPRDGLLYAGEPGVQLTWMDVKVDDWVVTPREGKPIEVNALWYNALCCMQLFAERLGRDKDAYKQMAEKARAGFSRFWYKSGDYAYDVIDGPDGHDSHLRPNQLLALSLSHSPLPIEQQKRILEVCTQHLLTSHGLRSLAPSDPDYVGRYGGEEMKTRDSAYHQGTVWGWLIGPFIAAHLRVYKDPVAARSYLEPALRHLKDHGLGTISEIFDGDAPFTPRGCPAQAWSVAEYLRAWCMIRTVERNQDDALL